MADRSITLKIGANVQGALNGLKTLARATQDASNKTLDYVERNEQHINGLSNGLGVAGAAVTAFSLLSLKKFADFDSAMSSVKSSGEDAAGSIGALREAAIEAGADTVFSATEAAGAIEELAKAGVSAKDVLSGGLKGSLDLAAAGGMDVGEAAEYASIAMTQFNLKGKDVGHIADLLAAGAGKAMGEVTDLGQALKQGGLVASQTGLSLEETTGTLSAFAAAGLLGSDAGTSLKTMLQRLSAPSGEAARLMEDLEISAYDASGEFVGMTNFAGQLTRAMGDMTPATRQAAMATIFGADAVRAAGVIYDQGETGIRDWITAVDDQGYAAETAATKLDNLKGDIEGLGGSVETALIGMGEGANGPLRDLVQRADEAVDGFNALPDPIKQATLLIAGTGGLAMLGAAGIGKLTIGLADARDAAKGLGVTLKGLKAAGIWGAALAGTVAIGAWAYDLGHVTADIDALSASIEHLGQVTSASELEAIRAQINGILAGDQGFKGALTGAKDIAGIGDALYQLADAKNAVGDTSWLTGMESWIGGLSPAAKQARTSVSALDEQLAALAQGGDPAAIASAMKLLNAEVAATNDGRWGTQLTMDMALNELPLFKAQMDLNTEATKEFASATVESTWATAAQVTTLEDAISGLSTLASMALAARDSQRGFEAAIDGAEDALTKSVEAGLSQAEMLDITTEAGRANQEALDGIAAANLRVVEDMQKNGAAQGEVQAAVERSRDEFLRMAGQMGLTAGEANALADELGLIPGDYAASVTVHTAEALRQIQAVQTAMGLLNDKTIDVTVRQQVYNTAATANQVAERLGGGYAGGRAGAIAAYAGGGRIPGTSPSNPREDNVLAVDASGMPRARYRSGEWIQSQPAVDYYGDDVMAAMNARRIPRELFSALPGRASGGPVGTWTHWVADARAQLARAKRSKDEKAIKVAEQRLDDNLAALARSRELVRDTRVDVRRGSIRDQATSGLSGGYSVVDQLLDQSRNTDLSTGSRTNLAAVAKSSESALKRLYGQAEKLEGRLAAARDRVQELSQIKAGVQSALMGGFSLADGMAQKQHSNRLGEAWYTAASGKSILAGAQGYARKVKAFAGLLDKLRVKGFSGVILQEVAGLGIEGGTEAANALLSMSKTDTKSLNSAYKSIEKWSGEAGQNVTEGFYKGGVAAAEGLVKGLESQQAVIEKQITKIAVGMEGALKKALGIKSPSRVFRGLGRHTGEGMVLGLGDKQDAVARAAADLASIPASVPMSAPVKAANASPVTVSFAGAHVVVEVDGQQMRGYVKGVAGRVVKVHADEQERAFAYVGGRA